MKVKVIGCGSINSTFNHASYVIDNKIVLDFSPMMCKNLLKNGFNLDKLSDIVITHFHGDHFFDLPNYLFYKSNSDNKKINIYCDISGEEKIKDLFLLSFPNSVDRLSSLELNYNNSYSFRIGKYKVDRYLVSHGKLKPAYGYVFNGLKKVGFTGDTSYCDTVISMAEECDYLFCDVTLTLGNETHMGVDDLIKLCQNNKKCTFIPTHMSNDSKEKINDLDFKNIILIEDGLELEF